MVPNYRRSHCLHRILGVAGGVAFVGEGEHAQVIVTVAKTDNPAHTEVFLDLLNSAALAGLAVMDVYPLQVLALNCGTGIGDKVRFRQYQLRNRRNRLPGTEGADIGNVGRVRQLCNRADVQPIYGPKVG